VLERATASAGRVAGRSAVEGDEAGTLGVDLQHAGREPGAGQSGHAGRGGDVGEGKHGGAGATHGCRDTGGTQLRHEVGRARVGRSTVRLVQTVIRGLEQEVRTAGAALNAASAWGTVSGRSARAFFVGTELEGTQTTGTMLGDAVRRRTST